MMLNEALKQQYGDLPAPDEEQAESVPVCPTCQGMGVIRYDVAVGDARFGKLFPCPEPTCEATHQRRLAVSQKVMNLSAWNAGYENLTFGSFKELMKQLGKNGMDGKRGAYAAARMFAAANGNPFTLNEAALLAFKKEWPEGKEVNRLSNCVVLTGGVGLGKTGLAVAAVNELRHLGQPVIFIRVLSLIAQIQETYQENATRTTDQVLSLFGSIPFLVIDEFTIENVKSDRLEKVEQIIRERDRRALPTMYTTNLNLDEIYQRWEPRIADIVAKSHWVQMGGLKLRNTSTESEVW